MNLKEVKMMAIVDKNYKIQGGIQGANVKVWESILLENKTKQKKNREYKQ